MAEEELSVVCNETYAEDDNVDVYDELCLHWGDIGPLFQ